KGAQPFRGIIDKAISEFFKVIQIPAVLRVGLRYINECPLFDRTSKTFQTCYDSILPINKFGLENLSRADCVAVAKVNEMQIQRIESLRLTSTGDALVLDLDASTESVDSSAVMEKSDRLHGLIEDEFFRSIKEPVLEYMRGRKN